MAGPNSHHSPSSRAADLDLLKTLLVIAMIGAHVVQLVTLRPRPEANVFAEYANLVSFSGFMFAFGIGLGLPKPKGRKRTPWQLVRPSLLLLCAVYASSFGFAMLVDRKPLTMQLAIDVVTMQRLFGWSEFLATFFMLSVVTLVARPALLAIGRNPWLLVGASVACLATTWIRTDAIVPLLPTLVSHTQFANFPLLPYLPWFLLGIWYGTHPVRAWHFVPALAVTGYLYWVTWQTGEFPGRFPPTILWIVGPAAILLGYLAFCRWLAARVTIAPMLLVPGRHVLSFLVLSNLGLFATRYFIGKPVRMTVVAALAAVAILVVLSAGWMLVERLRRTTRPLPASAAAPVR